MEPELEVSQAAAAMGRRRMALAEPGEAQRIGALGGAKRRKMGKRRRREIARLGGLARKGTTNKHKPEE